MIRRMEERDLPLIAELEKLCFSESWSYSILESGIHSPYDVYYVFEQAENILGYCGCWPVRGRCSALPCIRPAAAWDWAEK